MKEYIKCIIVTAKGNKIPHVCMYLSWFSVCVQYPLQLQKKKKDNYVHTETYGAKFTF